MGTDSFRRGLIFISLIFVLVVSTAFISSPVHVADVIIPPPPLPPTTVEVLPGENFTLRHRMVWDEPGVPGYYLVAIYWDYFGDNAWHFTPVSAIAYFDNDGGNLPDPGVALIDATVSTQENGTRFALAVSNAAGNNDDGYFNVDITLRAAGPDGTPHTVTDNHTIYYTIAQSLESFPPYVVTPPPVTVRVLGQGMAVAISPGYQNGSPGTTLSYSVTVTNTGGLEDTYYLTISDDKNWGPSLSENWLENVQPSEDRIVTLNVTVPENAASFDEDTITVSATSVENALVSDSASCVAASVPQEGFSEDFEGETWESLQQQGWKMAWDSPYYTSDVSVENGQLYIDMHVGGWGRSTYVWHDASWTDLSASINFNTIGYWRHSSARVILRASGFPALGGAYPEVNDWVGIAFHMGLEDGSSWILYLFTEDNNGDGNHEHTILKIDTTQPVYYGSWHLVEATVSSNNVKIWVDGTLWADVTDERISLLPPGGIAIASYEADTLVDNIVVNIGVAAFGGLEDLYAVRLEENLDLHQGSKLVVKFYTYSDAFENENVIENFVPPWHVEENEDVPHPQCKPVEKARLDLTTDNTENVISTIARLIVARNTLMDRVVDIYLEWPFASLGGRNALMSEIADMYLQWPFAPP